jgi:ethanolamine utilization protein EutQ (cupin superfamily)
MEQYKINFESIPWEMPADGVRFKAYKQNGKQVRLVEFTDRFVETDWCRKGHIVYILEGQLNVNFNGNDVVFNTGDGLFITAGEKDKHMGRALTKVVRMLFVEDVL